ncbi:MAG: hypothetical protein UR47_C0014G0022 [candidate division WS6 bacterium GW2011_GWB1_33_6]|uniref:Uncharacterized protein n=1 Tax=candidate division WS6 bacterium GW2011_GWB1_33_6 TaxID=1619088 RepID=A0A0G0CU00_9BACT|nr:MAG: hypothetical protein UR47_C0014G0022 [candidate division WS6 bacterium GW2011_GWB1_33_6]
MEDRVKKVPIYPNTPPRIKKESNLAIWNRVSGIPLDLLFAYVEDIESTRPPTTAIHVDIEAITPIRNTTGYVNVPALTRFVTPKF